MRWLPIVLVIATGVVGCATQTSQLDQGYALSGTDPRAQQKIYDIKRSQSWSTRDFAYPRGLVW